ncbi:MAG: alpha/beta fold hydrolase [Elusimicrobia bacterium]|nr:alpha/beta fold hydrolase [Elusimicrobiota bacterium]
MVKVNEKLYPFKGKYLQLPDGPRMHYLDQGSGDPVLMLHGNPSWSFYFRNLVGEIERSGRRAIAPDHIGCGLSDKPGASRHPYTLDTRVADIDALVNALGIGRNLTLVLHDWGGMIGMAWAVKHPEAVKRLVLINTAAFPIPAAKPFPPTMALARTPVLGPLLVRGLNLFMRGAIMTCCTRKPMPADVAEAFAAPYDSWKNREAVLKFVQDVPLRPGDRAWATVTATAEALPRFASTPALILWGGRDFVFDHYFLEEWKKRMPHAEIRLFQDAGHYLLEDAPEDVIPAILEFLNRS